jgi:hypothetical protein
MPILAGTVPCSECGGKPAVIRHTPNFERVFRFEEPLYFQVAVRACDIIPLCTCHAPWHAAFPFARAVPLCTNHALWHGSFPSAERHPS